MRGHHHVLQHRLVRKQIVLLEDHADLATQRELVELDRSSPSRPHTAMLSAVDRRQRIRAAQQRRLARSGGPMMAHDLAAPTSIEIPCSTGVP
jgi:hypothetical protein